MSGARPHFVVLGGGTAGWMSAAYLQRKLASPSGESVRVTVVESEEIPPIGVGEATIPSFVAMMRDLDIPEYRLFSEADATFKNAIKFVDWNSASSPSSGIDAFYHQFDPPTVTDGKSAIAHWLALKASGIVVEPMDVATCIGTALCEATRAPKLFNSMPYEAPIPYAYHIDSGKLGSLLRSVAEERGVRKVAGHVESVDRDEVGNIVSVHTRDGLAIQGDFFVDCSGFRSLLMQQVLGEPWVNFNDHLLCNTAITCQVPHETSKPVLRPFTTCTAQEAGWTWEIDLQSRTGVGYVYSNQFVSDEEARKTLLNHIGRRAAELETRKIDMRIGRLANSWVNNCLAVGLSGGFLEPLESTGIHLIELALRVFVDHIDLSDRQMVVRNQYNKLMRETYDEIAEFLMMHYCLNNRHGKPFWDYNREQVTLPPSLAEKLSLWQVKLPEMSDLNSKINVFSGFSYSAIMNGLHALPCMVGNLTPFVDLKKSAEVLDKIRHDRQLAIAASPKHNELVQKLRGLAG